MSLCSLGRIFHTNSSMPTVILMAHKTRSHCTTKSKKCWPRLTSTHCALRWQRSMYDHTTPKISMKPSHTLEPIFQRYLPLLCSTRDPIAGSMLLEMSTMFNHAWKMHLPATQMAPTSCMGWMSLMSTGTSQIKKCPTSLRVK